MALMHFARSVLTRIGLIAFAFALSFFSSAVDAQTAGAGAATYSPWKSITPDQRQYVAQPGGVIALPVRNNRWFRIGQYEVFTANADPNGLQISEWQSSGPVTLRSGEKWKATLLLDGRVSLDRNPGDLLPYGEPGPGYAMIYARNGDVTRWRAICVLPVGAGLTVQKDCFGGASNITYVPKASASCDSIPGLWSWFVNGDVTFSPGGTLVQGPRTGRWTCDSSNRQVRIVWSHGYTDDLILSPDGTRLSGRNDRQGSVAGQKKSGSGQSATPASPPPATPSAGSCSSIPGLWSWFVNGDVTFSAGGTLVQGPRTGRWTCDSASRQVRIVWSHGYTDDLILSADGMRLSGRNDKQGSVAGQRKSGG